MQAGLIICGEGPRPFRCLHCPADFVWGSKLQEHMASEHPPPPKLYSASENPPPPKLYPAFDNPPPSPKPATPEPSTRRSKRQKRNNTKPRAICPHCDKTFTLTCNRNSHVRRVHLKEVVGKRQECTECDAVFGAVGELKKHFERHHMEPEARGAYPCPHCPKSFLAKRSLEDHVNGVHLDNGFKCHVEGCGHSSITARHLKSHLMTHSNKKAFGCDCCHRTYKYEKDLRRHIRKGHKTNGEMKWPTIVSVTSVKEETC